MATEANSPPESVSLSNAGIEPLDVWIEPWCDELCLPPRSCLSFKPVPPAGFSSSLPELEIDQGRLIIWASAPGKAIVAIDCVEQDTGSRIIDLPQELFDMPVKNFVSAVFGAFPDARPGGRQPDQKRPFWRRLFRR